jgi:hypothetical protein
MRDGFSVAGFCWVWPTYLQIHLDKRCNKWLCSGILSCQQPNFSQGGKPDSSLQCEHRGLNMENKWMCQHSCWTGMSSTVPWAPCFSCPLPDKTNQVTIANLSSQAWQERFWKKSRCRLPAHCHQSQVLPWPQWSSQHYNHGRSQPASHRKK